MPSTEKINGTVRYKSASPTCRPSTNNVPAPPLPTPPPSYLKSVVDRVLARRQWLRRARIHALEAKKVVAVGWHTAPEIQAPAAEPTALRDDGAARLGSGHSNLGSDGVRAILDIENGVPIQMRHVGVQRLRGALADQVVRPRWGQTVRLRGHRAGTRSIWRPPTRRAAVAASISRDCAGFACVQSSGAFSSQTSSSNLGNLAARSQGVLCFVQAVHPS